MPQYFTTEFDNHVNNLISEILYMKEYHPLYPYLYDLNKDNRKIKLVLDNIVYKIELLEEKKCKILLITVIDGIRSDFIDFNFFMKFSSRTKKDTIFRCERMFTYEPCKKSSYMYPKEFLKQFDEIIYKCQYVYEI